jgi:hypothetical protein
MRVRRGVLGLAVVVAAAAVLALAPAARAVVITTGVLTDPWGTPTPGTVHVYAWPLHEGTIDLPELGTADAGPDGSFSVSTEDLSGLAGLADQREGSVDLFIASYTPTASDDTVASIAVDRAPDGSVSARAARAVDVPRPASVRLQLTPGPRGRAATTGPSCPPPRTTMVRHFRRKTVIGELNNAFHDTTAGFAYGKKADSSISVAVHPNGEGWSLDGTTSVENSQSSTVGVHGQRRVARRYLSRFRYGEEKIVTCSLHSPEYRIRAERWNGGLWAERQNHTLNVCKNGNTYPGGSTFDRTDKAAVTWKNAATLLGIGFTARSGFSQWVRTHFSFGGPAKRRHMLCGSHGQPETVAPRIFSGRR